MQHKPIINEAPFKSTDAFSASSEQKDQEVKPSCKSGPQPLGSHKESCISY